MSPTGRRAPNSVGIDTVGMSAGCPTSARSAVGTRPEHSRAEIPPPVSPMFRFDPPAPT